VTVLQNTTLGVWVLLAWVVLMLLALPWLAGRNGRHRSPPNAAPSANR
jgi:hypothetical protein